MKFRLASIAAVSFVAASGAHAIVVLNNGDQINLAALLDNGSDRKFRVGDKIFDVESFTSNQFNPGQVTIIGFHHPSNANEFGFDLTGGFGDTTPGDQVIHEFNLQYTVSIAPEFAERGYRITDNHLIFNGNATGAPGSYARVDETVIDPITGHPIGFKSVYDIVRLDAPNDSRFFDEIDWALPGYVSLELNKDVKFLALSEGSTSSCSFIRQSFSQIPTPGALSLLALGGIVSANRRRK